MERPPECGGRAGEASVAVTSFEEAAQARKVLAILSVVPCGRDAGEIAKVAEWLRGLDQPARDALAAEAGARSPSEETWSEVVRAAEQRRSVSEMFPVSGPPRLTVLTGGAR